MKRILIAAALLAASPASAQQMVGPLFNYVPPAQTPYEVARGKCFSDAPWVVPRGYYETCLAKARAVK